VVRGSVRRGGAVGHGATGSVRKKNRGGGAGHMG
jgi:hypothetical protein